MLNDTLFSNSFNFITFNFTRYHKTDSSSGAKCHYFAYILDGNVKYCDENGQLELSAGDVFYLPYRKKYKSFWRGSPKIKFISLGFGFLPNFQNQPFDMQKVECGKREKELFLKIAEKEVMTPEVVGLFYTLVGMLMPRLSPTVKTRAELLVARAKMQLAEAPDLSVKALARALAVSESALYLAFKRHSDIGIREYKESVVMNKARELLISTDTPIEEISSQLGFSSSSYFRKRFYSCFGKSARLVRKDYKL